MNMNLVNLVAQNLNEEEFPQFHSGSIQDVIRTM